MRLKHKNELFKKIQEWGYNVNLFTVDNTDKNCLITLKNSPLSFHITNEVSFDSFHFKYVTYSPEWFIQTGNCRFIGILLEDFQFWLKDHVNAYIEDQTSIDLWDIFTNNNRSQNLNYIDFSTSEKFTEDEKIQTQLLMNEFKNLLIERFDLQEEQIKIVNARLDYLVEATKRLNKFDWKRLCYKLFNKYNHSTFIGCRKSPATHSFISNSFSLYNEFNHENTTMTITR